MKLIKVFVVLLFLTALSPVYAADDNACGFGIFKCDDNGIVWNKELIANNSQVAQLSGSDGLAQFLVMAGDFMNNILVILLMAIAFLFFTWNLARYFIIEAAYADKKTEAKNAAIYGFAAFVLIVSIWGIVNLLVNGLNLDTVQQSCPDFPGIKCDGYLYGEDVEVDIGTGFGGSLDDGSGGAMIPPDSPGLTTPDSSPSTPNPTSPTTPGLPPTTPSPNNDGPVVESLTTGGDYSAVATVGLNTLFDHFNMETFLYNHLEAISGAGVSDDSRIYIAKAYKRAGLISQDELDTIVSAINTIRELEGATAIDQQSVPANQLDSDRFQTYANNLGEIKDFLDTWNGPGNASNINFERMFNTEDYSYQDRKKYAEGLVNSINSNDTNVNEHIADLINSTFAIEAAYRQ